MTSTATPVTDALNAPPSEIEPAAPAIFSADHLRVSPARTAAADGCSVATVRLPTLSETPKDEVSVSGDEREDQQARVGQAVRGDRALRDAERAGAADDVGDREVRERAGDGEDVGGGQRDRRRRGDDRRPVQAGGRGAAERAGGEVDLDVEPGHRRGQRAAERQRGGEAGGLDRGPAAGVAGGDVGRGRGEPGDGQAAGGDRDAEPAARREVRDGEGEQDRVGERAARVGAVDVDVQDAALERDVGGRAEGAVGDVDARGRSPSRASAGSRSRSTSSSRSRSRARRRSRRRSRRRPSS